MRLIIDSKSTLNENVTLGFTEENGQLDFKREINTKSDGSEIALDICQFLNSMGGVILVGVEEKIGQHNKKVATSFIDTNYEEVARFINDKVLNQIHPKGIKLNLSSIAVNSSVSILAVNIYPIAEGIACVSNNQPPFAMKFPYRTHYGKKYYSPPEASKHMSNSNRSIFIKLVELAEKHNEVRIYPDLSKENASSDLTWESTDNNVVLKNIGDYEYTINTCGIDVNIPFSLTKDVWITEKSEIGILLGMELIVSSDRKEIFFNLVNNC